MRVISIVEHKSEWKDEFLRIARNLREGVGDSVLRIDHIGSTSVPGLAAKDVVDIQLTVGNLSDSSPVSKLQKEGFRLQRHILSDLLVGTEEGSDELLKKLLIEPKGERKINIHIREEGRVNQRYPLVFRDYLRANPVVRSAYEMVKRRLAEIFKHDADGYYAIKDPFMDVIYEGAQMWATSERWTPDDQYQ